LLADPIVERFDWLDLACGKGQILAQLDENLSASQRSKIAYVGYDLNVEFGRLTEKRSSSLAFKEASVEVGELARFTGIVAHDKLFDFITLTNTIHELEPKNLAGILFDCVARLNDGGSLFVYDMEKLPSPELGAVPWKAPEIEAILTALLRPLGVNGYAPAIGRWRHRNVAGWNTQIEKRHVIREAGSLDGRRVEAVNSASKKIVEILKSRKTECCAALQSLARFGSSTGNESAEEVAFLYEFWAVDHALGEI
jgi:SAM-dependent methyltransferase